MLDEIADPVAPIEQPPVLAVDIAEGRFGRDHPLEAGGVGPLVGHVGMVAAGLFRSP